jgi:DNA-binding Xre family transcriptional regulator
MIKKMGSEWHLRLRMAERGLFATSELVPLLAERGIHLSREQVYRLVTTPPQRLSMDVLAALCDILDCTPNDLITVAVVTEKVTKAAGQGAAGGSGKSGSLPVNRTRIRRPGSGAGSTSGS